jgi:hypothetical protein
LSAFQEARLHPGIGIAAAAHPQPQKANLHDLRCLNWKTVMLAAAATFAASRSPTSQLIRASAAATSPSCGASIVSSCSSRKARPRNSADNSGLAALAEYSAQARAWQRRSSRGDRPDVVPNGTKSA